MHLKHLLETAAWQKLNEQDFRMKATGRLLLYEKDIENLSHIIEQLTEDVQTIKKQIGTLSLRNNKLTRNLKTNMQDNDESFIKPKRDNRPIS